MIDQFLVAAVIYAQSILDQNVSVMDDIVEKYEIGSPYVAVFTEVPIPYTKVRCGNTSYTFHGVLDYGIGYISTTLKGKLIYFLSTSYFTGPDALRMSGVPFEPSGALSGIIQAKSLEEFRNATLSVLLLEAKILHWSPHSWQFVAILYCLRWSYSKTQTCIHDQLLPDSLSHFAHDYNRSCPSP